MKKDRWFLLFLVMGWVGCRSPDSRIPNLKPVNINFMNRGYFYAASPPLEKTAGFGGWADDGNMFKTIQTAGRFRANALSVVVDTDEWDVFAEHFRGTVLYVANTRADTIFFSAQDSRIEMILEAKDGNGQWKPIEYLPHSWCGNSYHLVYLPSKAYWEFTIPRYEGRLKTKLRAVLYYKQELGGRDRRVTSNEFEGAVNSGQFSIKLDYEPKDIMDPYNN